MQKPLVPHEVFIAIKDCEGWRRLEAIPIEGRQDRLSPDAAAPRAELYGSSATGVAAHFNCAEEVALCIRNQAATCMIATTLWLSGP